jgi:hypothetical protein
MHGEAGELRTLADASAHSDGLAAAARRTASFYADPVAWLVVSALRAALGGAPSEVRSRVAEIGVLAVSEHGTRHTMRSVAASAARGRVSPLRFAGASPGSLAGLPCIVLGFRGPSLLLCMAPREAAGVAALTVSGWLASGQCRYAALAEHTAEGDRHTVGGRILGLVR